MSDFLNLAGANLERKNLECAYMENANLKGANLIKTNLTGTILINANLDEAVMTHAWAEGVLLKGASLKNDLRGAYFGGAVLDETNLTNADLSGSCLTVAEMKGAKIDGVNFRNADVDESYFRQANLNPIKNDLFDWITNNKTASISLKSELISGTFDGIKNEFFLQNPSRAIARFALAIKEGQTNLFSKIILEWTDELES